MTAPQSPDQPTSARERMVLAAPVTVLRPPGEDDLRSPIYDDAEQIAATPDVIEQ